MKKVLFFIHNGWVFGKIHNELIKALHPDVYCDIACWNNQYTHKDFELFLKKYDYIMSIPYGCFLIHERYGVQLERTIGVLHQDCDVYNPVREGKKDWFEKLGGYAAIAPLLQNVSLSHGVGRIPELLRIGVFQNQYPKNNAFELKKIGSFAKGVRNDQGYDVKRGNLIDLIAQKTNLELIKSESVNFLAVEQMYRDIELVIFASLVEGNPYPMLEAFAAGIPVLGTSTGIAPEYLKHGGGKLLPLNADDLVYSASYEIEKMKSDKSYYRSLCDESYEIGKMIDWSNIREEWINYINNL
jgi:glycosyltransferase involved in cell wall biosynthesis